MTPHPHHTEDARYLCFLFKKPPTIGDLSKISKLIGYALGKRTVDVPLEKVTIYNDGANWICIQLSADLGDQGELVLRYLDTELKKAASA